MTFSREFTADLEIRSDGTGRTIHGIVVPYGQVARVRDGGAPYDEMFQQGAFTKTLAERRSPVKLLSQHDPRNPMGVMVEHRDDAAGLYGAFRVSNISAASDQLELARDGVLDGFSVGFAPVKQVNRNGTTVRTEVKLREVSLVTFPAYEGALVAGIRSVDGAEAALLQQLLTTLAVSDAQLDPIVDALCAADGALDQAQQVIAQILAVPDPDPGEGADMAEPMMQNHSSLISLARRLDAALATRAGTPSLGAVSHEPPSGHSGRLLVARNNLRAALIERGIRP
jgi:HK97 family phage prohead protease